MTEDAKLGMWTRTAFLEAPKSQMWGVTSEKGQAVLDVIGRYV